MTRIPDRGMALGAPPLYLEALRDAAPTRGWFWVLEPDGEVQRVPSGP